ncbi:right-handed parallel beta-helix repeat-containing protein [Dokdonella sp.]|uniref:right-handed parallel beta-helix repeat-containing protein n=1 Tax=Dokdonella sp. TaxID=2291710 RepID=UPI0025BAD77D|nr:right-handed parallel beta-helix repeat-containing protein [Dokdonella sp.]MBX3690980.1 right-handed parallel beta-helix repeat-containing protein [Dokdonella sp.]MCW5567463.1 right-handed parallel beta-helix repeat-containing protein [Dokdonella sp.]
MRLTLLIMGLLPACVFAANCVRPGDSVFASSFDIPAQRAFYVASNGSNGADGSLATPWRTIQHGIDVAQAGDLVCVRGGIYNELVSMTRSGSLAAGPIVLQSVPGETAIIDGTGLPIPDGQYGLVTLIDVSHVSVQGLELRNYTTASTALVPIGMYVTGAGTRIRLLDNHIHAIRNTGNGCAANAFGLKVDGTRAPQSINDLIIAGNDIHDLVLGCSESFSLDGNVENWIISNNRVHDTNNIGIGAIGFEGVAPNPAFDQARDGLIVGNHVYNISSFGNPAYGNEYAADGIYVDGGKRITIEHNRIHHVDIGIEVASEHAGRTSSEVIVRNNLVYSGNSAGISIGGYDASVGGSTAVEIYGNTLVRNDQAGTGSGEFQIQYHATNNRFANNILYASSDGVLISAYTGDTPAPAILNHNLYWTDSGSTPAWTWLGTEYNTLASYRSASGQDGASLFDNPDFFDLVAPDLRLQTGSPGINAGSDPGNGLAGLLDFAGLPRIQGAAIDIGAHER